MESTRLQDALKVIGLPGYAPRRTRRQDPPPNDVGRGFRASPVRDLLDVSVAAPPTSYDLSLPEMESIGFTVRRHEDRPLVIRIFAEGQVVQAHPLAGPCADVVLEGESVFLDLEQAGPVIVYTTPGSPALLAEPEGHGIRFTELLPEGEAPPEAPSIACDADRWAEAFGDAWLAGEARGRIAVGGPYGAAVAAGMVLRVLEPAEPRGAPLDRARFGAAAAAPDERFEPVRSWIASLSADQVAAIEREAVAEAQLLVADLEAAIEAPDPDDEVWRLRMLRLLHARDDLESVRTVLFSVAAGEELEPELEILDDSGRIAIDCVPKWSGVADDEQLSRAGRVSPLSWWTAPLAWGE